MQKKMLVVALATLFATPVLAADAPAAPAAPAAPSLSSILDASGITATGPNTSGASTSLTPGTTQIWTPSTIYLNVGTAQGGTSQGNFYLYGYPVF